MRVHPFRFAVHTGGGELLDDWAAFARRAEALGYAAVYVTDHLGRGLSPIAAMASAAAATSTIRIGSYVFANDFRHPLILAREAATLPLATRGPAAAIPLGKLRPPVPLLARAGVLPPTR